jgi:hypothetical protein
VYQSSYFREYSVLGHGGNFGGIAGNAVEGTLRAIESLDTVRVGSPRDLETPSFDVWREDKLGRGVMSELVIDAGLRYCSVVPVLAVEVVDRGLGSVLARNGADNPSGQTWKLSCDGMRTSGPSSSGYGKGGLVIGLTGEGDCMSIRGGCCKVSTKSCLIDGLSFNGLEARSCVEGGYVELRSACEFGL